MRVRSCRHILIAQCLTVLILSHSLLYLLMKTETIFSRWNRCANGREIILERSLKLFIYCSGIRADPIILWDILINNSRIIQLIHTKEIIAHFILSFLFIAFRWRVVRLGFSLWEHTLINYNRIIKAFSLILVFLLCKA